MTSAFLVFGVLQTKPRDTCTPDKHSIGLVMKIFVSVEDILGTTLFSWCVREDPAPNQESKQAWVSSESIRATLLTWTFFVDSISMKVINVYNI